MKILRFEGYSDDTFGEYGETQKDYDNCASGKPIEFCVLSGGESLAVIGQYGVVRGNWLIGISPTGDDEPMPDWLMWYEHGERPYSPCLCIQVGDDFTLDCVTAGVE